ncbi:translocation/assembly module TamB domain-containing protein [Dongia soli]|uniref:Translocation/assembly module TamB domain-containing protein n=1 Tax=Dongia soli TaxID=600628 RepID=A0ABU5ECU5_9PROT|nr:translocation/assembly module TamB domain-containing protein [Dongia soli]MDY0884191.1 translocation/assembly module TamB domain-containing protein [Dongia soli]
MRRIVYIALALVVILPLLAIGGIFAYLQTEAGRQQILVLLRDQTAAGPIRIEAGKIEGVIPFDMRLADIKLSDVQGVWLEADQIQLAWSPGRLFARQVRIDNISAGTISLHRLPNIPPSTEPEPAKPDEGPLLPSLPVAIDLQRLAIERIDLGQPVLGEAARFTLDAAASLGRPSDGLMAKLSLKRIDRDNDRVTADLAYRPSDDFLKVRLQVHEPQGGLITRLAALPGEPDFQATVNGEGPLANWQGQASIRLDAQDILALQATTTGESTKRRITFTATGDPHTLVPKKITPLVEGGIKATGDIRLDQSAGLVNIDSLQIDSRAASIAAQGSVGLEQAGDLHLQITSSAPEAFAALAPGIGWKTVSVDGRITGKIALPTADITASVTDLAAAEQRIGGTKLEVHIVPRGSLDQPIDLIAGLQVTDITPADAQLKPVLETGIQLALSGSFTKDGNIDLPKIELRAGTVALDANATATQWGGDKAHLNGKLHASNIAPLAALAGMSGKGSLDLDMLADNSPSGAALTIKGAAADLSLGQAMLDGLLGPTPKLAVDVSRDPEGRINIREFNLAAKSLQAEASGSIADEKIDVTAKAGLTNLSVVDPKANGTVALDLTASGTMDAPSANVTLTSDRIRYDTYNLTALNVTAQGQDLKTAPNLTIDGRARVNDLPATIGTRLEMGADHRQMSLPRLMAQLGRTSLQGQASLADNLTKGTFKLNSPDLAELGRLTGLALQGSVSADIALQPDGTRQDAKVSLTAQKIAFQNSVKLEETKLTAQVADALGTPNLDARLSLRNLDVPQRHFDTVVATARGPISRMALTTTASGPETALDLAAGFSKTVSGQTIDLTKLNLSMQQEKILLSKPAQIVLSNGTTEVRGLSLKTGGGSVTADAKLATDRNDASLLIDKLPLSLARIADPSLQMTGTISGNLRLSGPHRAPVAQMSLTGNNIAMRGISMQPVDLKIGGDWQGGQLQAKGHINLGGSDNILDLSAALPLPANPANGFPAMDMNATLQAQAKGQIDLSLANAMLAGGADHVGGRARIDVTASGTMNAPMLAGGIELQNGQYENVRYGVKLRSMQAKVQANGPRIDLVSFNARTPGGGSVSGSGQIGLQGDQPIKLKLGASQAQLINTEMAMAVTNADLSIDGTLKEQITLGGTVKVIRAEIRIPDKLPPSVQQISVVEINGSEKQMARAEAKRPPARTLGINLDLTIDAPQQVAIRGRGLDAELGGNMRVTGTTDRPIIRGALRMRRGQLDLLGRNLTFNRGQVTFDGGEVIDPLLDFEAKTRAENYDIVVDVGGSASAPTFALTSSPALPQDEVLARLLFGKASGSLSALEALQLAQAMAQLAGIESGPGILDRVRRATGLDRLSVDAGDTGSSSSNRTGPSLTAGRYVSEGVFVGLKQGTQAGTSAATVEIEITPNIKLETDVGADTGSRAGINMQWDY